MNKNKTSLRSIAAFILLSFGLEIPASAAPEIRPVLFSHASPLSSLTFSKSVATVDGSYKGRSGRTLILIQDAHTNESGQLHISQALETILRDTNVRLVFLEGAEGHNSLAEARANTPVETRRRIAREWLRKGLIDGSEHLDLTTDAQFVPWGVEDKALYWESLKAYEKVAKDRDRMQAYLRQVESAVEALKPRIYGPALSAFDAKQQDFRRGKSSMAEYVETLVREAGAGLAATHYPHLKAFAALRETEKRIDFDKANEQQSRALSRLSEDERDLLSGTLSSMAGKLVSGEERSEEAFYALLDERIADDPAFAELSRYIDYRQAARDIDARAVLDERKALERAVYDSLIRTEDERGLRRVDEALGLLKQLFDLTITPEEFREYKKARDQYDIVALTGFLNRKIMDLRQRYERINFVEEDFLPTVGAAEEFYHLTYRRDMAFLENALSIMDRTGEETAALIAGGYHTPNLSALLRDKGISFVVVTPQILQETNRKRYESLLLSQSAADLGLGASAGSADQIALFHQLSRLAAELPKLRTSAAQIRSKRVARPEQALPRGPAKVLRGPWTRSITAPVNEDRAYLENSLRTGTDGARLASRFESRHRVKPLGALAATTAAILLSAPTLRQPEEPVLVKTTVTQPSLQQRPGGGAVIHLQKSVSTSVPFTTTAQDGSFMVERRLNGAESFLINTIKFPKPIEIEAGDLLEIRLAGEDLSKIEPTSVSLTFSAGEGAGRRHIGQAELRRGTVYMYFTIAASVHWGHLRIRLPQGLAGSIRVHVKSVGKVLKNGARLAQGETIAAVIDEVSEQTMASLSGFHWHELNEISMSLARLKIDVSNGIDRADLVESLADIQERLRGVELTGPASRLDTVLSLWDAQKEEEWAETPLDIVDYVLRRVQEEQQKGADLSGAESMLMNLITMLGAQDLDRYRFDTAVTQVQDELRVADRSALADELTKMLRLMDATGEEEDVPVIPLTVEAALESIKAMRDSTVDADIRRDLDDALTHYSVGDIEKMKASVTSAIGAFDVLAEEERGTVLSKASSLLYADLNRALTATELEPLIEALNDVSSKARRLYSLAAGEIAFDQPAFWQKRGVDPRFHVRLAEAYKKAQAIVEARYKPVPGTLGRVVATPPRWDYYAAIRKEAERAAAGARLSDAAPIQPLSLEAFQKRVARTVAHLRKGRFGPVAVSHNNTRFVEDVPELYRAADRKLERRFKQLRTAEYVRHLKELLHDFPGFLAALKALIAKDPHWKNHVAAVVTDGGEKTRPANVGLSFGYTGLWTLPGSRYETLRDGVLINILTILTHYFGNHSTRFLAWAASDNFIFLGKARIGRISLAETELIEPLLEKATVVKGAVRLDLLEAEDIRLLSLLSSKQGWAAEDIIGRIGQRRWERINDVIREEKLTQLGTVAWDSQGVMTAFLEKEKNPASLIELFYRFQSKGQYVGKNPFLEYLHKDFAEKLLARLEAVASKSDDPNIGTLSRQTVSYMQSAYQSRFVTMEKWEKLVPKDKTGAPKIPLEDWKRLKEEIDRIFEEERQEGRGDIYIIDFGRGNQWFDLGNLDEWFDFLRSVATDDRVRRSLGIKEGVSFDARSTIGNVSVEEGAYVERLVNTGPGELVVKQGALVTSLIIEVPEGKVWTIEGGAVVKESDLRGYSTIEIHPGAMVERVFRIDEATEFVAFSDERVATVRLTARGVVDVSTNVYSVQPLQEPQFTFVRNMIRLPFKEDSPDDPKDRVGTLMRTAEWLRHEEIVDQYMNPTRSFIIDGKSVKVKDSDLYSLPDEHLLGLRAVDAQRNSDYVWLDSRVHQLQDEIDARLGARLAAVLPTVEPTRTNAWKALRAEKTGMRDFHLRHYQNDEGRQQRMSHEFVSGDTRIHVDFSKNLIKEKTLTHLMALARAVKLPKAIQLMFDGAKINETEKRAALHTALRAPADAEIYVDGENIVPKVHKVLAQMKKFIEDIHSGAWKGYAGDEVTDIVNIGIGGSDLGPLMASEALKPFANGKVRVHYVSNVDGTDFMEKVVKAGLDPKKTLFIIASKTFTTEETMTNARSAREWFLSKSGGNAEAIKKHFVAVSTAEDKVREFGIDPANMFEFWDWVGGRYSMWSAIGLSTAAYIGYDNFIAMLEGAHDMDEHFRKTPLERNIPVIKALLGVWYRNFYGAQTQAVLPYSQYLHRFPAYLQQLTMESNGKSVNRLGKTISYLASSVWWGEPGTNGQHSFHQLLHQIARQGIVPADFIGVAVTENPLGDHDEKLFSNFTAQPMALANGLTREEVAEVDRDQERIPHRVFEGNGPTTSILVNRLTPRTLGALVAMYEHQVFVEGIIMNIFSFDQWGVELGKKLAGPVRDLLIGKTNEQPNDASARAKLSKRAEYLAGARLAEPKVVVADSLDHSSLPSGNIINVSTAKDRTAAIIEADPEILIVRSETKVTAALMDKLARLKVVIRAGHGVDNVDVEHAAAKGIQVLRTRGSERSVSALALRMMLSAAQGDATAEKDEAPAVSALSIDEWRAAMGKKIKKVPAASIEAAQRSAERLFGPISAATVASLENKVVGIIGYGAIAQQLARELKGLGMAVVITTPRLVRETKGDFYDGYTVSTPEGIYKHADFVVLLTGLYEKGDRRNVGMVDAQAAEYLSQNKNLVALINPDRGPLVDESALLSAMERSSFAYYVDDVPATEAMQARAIFTPHIGASTPTAEKDVLARTAETLKDIRTELDIIHGTQGARLTDVAVIPTSSLRGSEVVAGMDLRTIRVIDYDRAGRQGTLVIGGPVTLDSAFEIISKADPVPQNVTVYYGGLDSELASISLELNDLARALNEPATGDLSSTLSQAAVNVLRASERSLSAALAAIQSVQTDLKNIDRSQYTAISARVTNVGRRLQAAVDAWGARLAGQEKEKTDPIVAIQSVIDEVRADRLPDTTGYAFIVEHLKRIGHPGWKADVMASDLLRRGTADPSQIIGARLAVSDEDAVRLRAALEDAMPYDGAVRITVSGQTVATYDGQNFDAVLQDVGRAVSYRPLMIGDLDRVSNSLPVSARGARLAAAEEDAARLLEALDPLMPYNGSVIVQANGASVTYDGQNIDEVAALVRAAYPLNSFAIGDFDQAKNRVSIFPVRTSLSELPLDIQKRQIRTVLINEDEPAITDLLKTLIERAIPGVSIAAVPNTDEALKALDGRDFDWVITDHSTPPSQKTGIDLIRSLADRPVQPFITSISGWDAETAKAELGALIVERPDLERRIVFAGKPFSSGVFRGLISAIHQPAAGARLTASVVEDRPVLAASIGKSQPRTSEIRDGATRVLRARIAALSADVRERLEDLLVMADAQKAGQAVPIQLGAGLFEILDMKRVTTKDGAIEEHLEVRLRSDAAGEPLMTIIDPSARYETIRRRHASDPIAEQAREIVAANAMDAIRAENFPVQRSSVKKLVRIPSTLFADITDERELEAQLGILAERLQRAVDISSAKGQALLVTLDIAGSEDAGRRSIFERSLSSSLFLSAADASRFRGITLDFQDAEAPDYIRHSASGVYPILDRVQSGSVPGWLSHLMAAVSAAQSFDSSYSETENTIDYAAVKADNIDGQTRGFYDSSRTDKEQRFDDGEWSRVFEGLADWATARRYRSDLPILREIAIDAILAGARLATVSLGRSA